MLEGTHSHMDAEGNSFCVLEWALRGQCNAERKLNSAWRGNSVGWSSSLKREVLWPGWGKEIILFPDVQLMPLCISEGYHSKCHFEERPVVSGRYVGLEQVASGEKEIQGLSQLCFGTQAHLAPNFVKALTFLN